MYPLPAELETYRRPDGSEGKLAWFYKPISPAAIAAQSHRDSRVVGLAVADAITDRYLGSYFPANWTTEQDLGRQLASLDRFLKEVDQSSLSGPERARFSRRRSSVDRRIGDLQERWAALWSNADELWTSIKEGHSNVTPSPRER
jgi:hypothetical protein